MTAARLLERVKVEAGNRLVMTVSVLRPFTARIVALHASSAYLVLELGKRVLDQDSVLYEKRPLVVDVSRRELLG